MGICLKLKKAFRKPSVNCSSTGACITHLPDLWGWRKREQRKSKAPQEKEQCFLLGVVFLLYSVNNLFFLDNPCLKYYEECLSLPQWAVPNHRGDSTDPVVFYFETQMTKIFQTTCKHTLRVTSYMSLKYKHAQVHFVPRAGCGCAETLPYPVFHETSWYGHSDFGEDIVLPYIHCNLRNHLQVHFIVTW